MFYIISFGSLIYVLGLGCLVTSILYSKKDDLSFVAIFPLIFTSGLIASFLLVLLCQSLTISLTTGFIFSGFSVLRMSLDKKSLWHDMQFPKKTIYLVSLIIIILFLYYVKIMFDPIEGWDARSIWFFHAKMIFSAETINQNAGWNHSTVAFSHVDYPKLVPVLTAQIAYVLGYWNEHAPKLSLFLLLIPTIFWIYSFFNRRISFLFLALVFPFGVGVYLWNGYMDGYIAFYTATGALLLGRYINAKKLLDIYSAAACFALIAAMKNEGLLIGEIGVFVIIIIVLLMSDRNVLKELQEKKIRIFVWLVLVISPSIIWSIFYKYAWGLSNDLHIGTSGSILKIFNRLHDGSLTLILQSTLSHDHSSVLLSLSIWLALLMQSLNKKRFNLSWVPALVLATFYYCGIVLIYLMTPHDLRWHLETSATRTMLTVNSCIIVGIFYIWKALEEGPQPRHSIDDMR